MKLFEKIPTPFQLAIILTLLTMLFALVFTLPEDKSVVFYSAHILDFWHRGFWGLLEFSMQMVLILVLGHILALTPPVNYLIGRLAEHCQSNVSAAVLITIFTIIAGFINWGLALIFGAILCRRVGEYAAEHQIPINYPLLGAAAYTGLMVWHGGLSGSAPLVVSGADHFLIEQTSVISLSETIFSTMNMVVFAALLLFLPLLMYFTARTSKTEVPLFLKADKPYKTEAAKFSPYAVAFGLLFLFAAFMHIMISGKSLLDALSLNFINFCLFGAGILMMGNFDRYIAAAKNAVKGGTGIILQFPLYAGIMSIMNESGLLVMLTELFINHASERSFPLLVFFSAAIVNVFVPSGGGQWIVQGPVVIEAAQQLNVTHAKAVMALAYGDQLTNMIQPFWALPLLAITGLDARKMLPYTFMMMIVGGIIYLAALLTF